MLVLWQGWRAGRGGEMLMAADCCLEGACHAVCRLVLLHTKGRFVARGYVYYLIIIIHRVVLILS